MKIPRKMLCFILGTGAVVVCALPFIEFTQKTSEMKNPEKKIAGDLMDISSLSQEEKQSVPQAHISDRAGDKGMMLQNDPVDENGYLDNPDLHNLLREGEELIRKGDQIIEDAVLPLSWMKQHQLLPSTKTSLGMDELEAELRAIEKLFSKYDAEK